MKSTYIFVILDDFEVIETNDKMSSEESRSIGEIKCYKTERFFTPKSYFNDECFEDVYFWNWKVTKEITINKYFEVTQITESVHSKGLRKEVVFVVKDIFSKYKSFPISPKSKDRELSTDEISQVLNGISSILKGVNSFREFELEELLNTKNKELEKVKMKL